jgi:hypothetical protein
MTFVLVAVGFAVFIGMRSERARQAHQNWYMYKARIASMRGVRMKETLRAALGVFALVAMIIMLTGTGG